MKAKKETKAQFNQIQFINKNDIKPDENITQAYRTIAKKTNLGSQHEWLARLAKENPGLELGTEAGTKETSHIINALEEFTVIEYDEDGVGYLNKEKSSKEGWLVFGNHRFPILQKTELDMLNIIREWGYEDVMKNIWFCHTPIDNKPCGICHPCHVKIESQMDFLFHEKATKRYKIHIVLEKLFGEQISSKIMYKISKII